MKMSNGDTDRIWNIVSSNKANEAPETVRGLGSFHKSLPHNEFGEVDPPAFAALVAATRGDGSGFAQVPAGKAREIDPPVNGSKFAPATVFTNPQAGLASDRLIHDPHLYSMPPAPGVMSNTTAAEMVELYWAAILRDCDPSDWGAQGQSAVDEINEKFQAAIGSSFVTPSMGYEEDADGPDDRFIQGVDVPEPVEHCKSFSQDTLFRLGFPGDNVGPMISQFFLRPAPFGTQKIDQRQRPYKSGMDYLTGFDDWLMAQNSGCDGAGGAYPKSNEAPLSATDPGGRFEKEERYIVTPRDLARFVNKDALHQAYFNAALILLSGDAKWPLGNPYHNVDKKIVKGPLADREAGFGVLGGPHILALVSEVATRALKAVWYQKWQVNLRLRPEAYAGLLHVQNIGVKGVTRNYGLPSWLTKTKAVKEILKITEKANGGDGTKTMLLPMAFTAGSPTHPAYGAGHATVAGACVTVLKAYFLTYTIGADGKPVPVGFQTLNERSEPYGKGQTIVAYRPTLDPGGNNRKELKKEVAKSLTIEGELNKLAQNVAMGRSMGGVHWRTDNTRSLMLGEALAAEILAQITLDANERPSFTFRTFSRRADGQPKLVVIEQGRIFVDGVEKAIPVSAL